MPLHSHRTTHLWQRFAALQGWACGAVLVVVCAIYSMIFWHAFPPLRANIGDDFAYAAWQMSLGHVLYREILGQQMPLLYLIGAAWYHIWPSPTALGVAALAIRLTTVAIVFALARRIGLPAWWVLAAAIVYLLFPMGFLFGARFDANALLALWGAAATLALTRTTRRAAVLGGICCACAVLSKLTGLTFVATFALYLLLTNRRAVLPYGLTCIAIVMAATAAGWWIAGPSFVTGAYLAHAHDPRSWWSVITAASYLWRVEGGMILVALVAIAVLWRRQRPGIGLLIASFLGGAGALAATATLGSDATNGLGAEPAAAILAAWIGSEATSYIWRRHTIVAVRTTTRRLAALAVVGAIIIFQVQAVRTDGAALAPNDALRDDSCPAIAVRALTPPGGQVLVPAYVALLAQREQAAGIADSFNWTMRVEARDPVALAQLKGVIGLLQRREIAVVMVDWAHPLPATALAQLQARDKRTIVCGSIPLYSPR